MIENRARLPVEVVDDLSHTLGVPVGPTVGDAKHALHAWLIRERGFQLPPLGELTLRDLHGAVVDSIHSNLDHVRELRIYSPLSLAVLWRNDELDIDQRRMFIRAAQERMSWEKGGNRAGKTYAALILDVCTALSTAHPMVRRFCHNNDIPLDILPDTPQDVVVVAESASLSIRDHRTPIEEMLPRDEIVWYHKNSKDEAHLDCIVPGYDRPGRIWFKSVKQTHKAFKGGKAFRYHIDEEPSSREGQLVIEECFRGVAAVGGNVSITATPQEGSSWLRERLVDKVPPDYDCVVMSLDALGNRLVEDYDALVDYFDRLERTDPRQARMRRFGDFVDRKGLVVGDHWSRGDYTPEGTGHVVDDFDIPAEWPRFRGADFGVGDPTFVVWGAREPSTGILYVYRDYEVTGKGAEGHIKPLHAAQGDKRVEVDGIKGWRSAEPYQGSWGDPSAKAWMDVWCEHDLEFEPANRDRQMGIGAVLDRLAPGPDGRPRLRIFRSCTSLLKSVENLAWDPNSRVPMWLKKNDHGWDALRYLCVGVLESWESAI